jgi:hypothetical protein
MDIFKQIALVQVPRILGFWDRKEDSKSYGCVDRYYWHYKLHDFTNARFQEASLLLAMLHRHNFPGNIYYNRKKVLQWLKASVGFWLKTQNRNGSFNEYYPHEYSYCATSFSTYANTEAMLLAGIKPDNRKLLKTGKWLAGNHNPQVSNQVAASAIALLNIHLVSRDASFRDAAQQKISSVLQVQHATGYYPEYGGYDIGYQTITLSCLGHYYLKTGDREVYKSLKKGVNFLKARIGPDGSYDNSGTSRRTQYLHPFGLAIMKSDIIKKIIHGLERNSIPNPAWMDDRYCIHLTNDYLQAYLCDKNVHG